MKKKKKKPALRPVEPFKAFSFKSVNVQFRTSSLSCTLSLLSQSFHLSTWFPVGGQLSQVASLQGHQPTTVPFMLSCSLTSQLCPKLCFLFTIPSLSAAVFASSSLQEEKVLFPAQCSFSCSHLCCQPLLPSPFLQAVGVPVSSLLKELLVWVFGPYPVIVLLFPAGRGQAFILYYSLVLKWFQTHIYYLCCFSSFFSF